MIFRTPRDRPVREKAGAGVNLAPAKAGAGAGADEGLKNILFFKENFF